MGDQLLVALQPFDSGRRQFVAAEAALGEVVQQAKTAAQAFAGVLPTQLSREMAGALLGIICHGVLAEIFKLQNASPEEITVLSSLLSETLSLGRQVFQAARLELSNTDLADNVPCW